MSKGSRRRPVAPHADYDVNWERAFGSARKGLRSKHTKAHVDKRREGQKQACRGPQG